jgi:mannan endo-1,4-beta-mannosidase
LRKALIRKKASSTRPSLKSKRPFRNHKLLAVIAACVLAGIGLILVVFGASAPPNFVYRSGTTLMLNGAPYKFVGLNAYGITGCQTGNPWSQSQIDSYFASLQPASMTRLWAFQGLNETALDAAVASAAAHNQKLVLSLNNNSDCTADGAKTTSWFVSGYKSGPFLSWTQHLAGKYKNSPAIGMWEVMNEAGANLPNGSLNPTDMKNFYETVASTIKAVDPNHLVETGDIGEYTYSGGASGYQTASSAPDIDVLDLHDYEPDYENNAPLVNSHFAATHASAQALGKPIIIGEMNESDCAIGKPARATSMKSRIDAVLAAGAAGAMVWDYTPWPYTDCPDDYEMGTSDPLVGVMQHYSIPGNVTSPSPTPSPAGNVGDINNDGSVNIFDLSTLLSDWGTANAAADLNKDGTVNVFDLSTLLSHWGT